MKNVVLDTNCLLASLSRNKEDSIGFPKVNHIRIDDFVAMLKKSKKK